MPLLSRLGLALLCYGAVLAWPLILPLLVIWEFFPIHESEPR